MEKYKKVKVVGKGSFGHAILVHAVENPSRLFIIKVIDISKMERKQKEEALNEVHILKAMRHPYIVTYRESFIEKRCLCIVMDYADGGDLYTKINQHKKNKELFTEDEILDWFVQIALALKYIHDRKILHRDIKTQNIFLTKSSEIKLGDFGIARILRDADDYAKTAIGTPYYLSPEICREKPYNQKSDIWSLGCILYELTTLNHAFDADTMKGLVLKILKGSYEPIASHFSDNLRGLISEMLTKDPNNRPSIKTILQKEFLYNRIGKILKNTLSKHKFQDLSGRLSTMQQPISFDTQNGNDKDKLDSSGENDKRSKTPVKSFAGVWDDEKRGNINKNLERVQGTVEEIQGTVEDYEEQKTIERMYTKEGPEINIQNIINENLSLMKNPKQIFYHPQLLSKLNISLNHYNIISNNLNRTPESELFGISNLCRGDTLDIEKAVSGDKNELRSPRSVEDEQYSDDDSDQMVFDLTMDRCQNLRRHLTDKLGVQRFETIIKILESEPENPNKVAEAKAVLGLKHRNSLGLLLSLVTIEKAKSQNG